MQYIYYIISYIYIIIWYIYIYIWIYIFICLHNTFLVHWFGVAFAELLATRHQRIVGRHIGLQRWFWRQELVQTSPKMAGPWVIKCPHWTSPNHKSVYGLFYGYYLRWCSIFPKWDSYQPLWFTMEDPKITWMMTGMMTGGSPILGNLYVM